MLAPNCLEFAPMVHACLGQGVIVSTYNTNYTVTELKHQITDSKTKVMVCAYYLYVSAVVWHVNRRYERSVLSHRLNTSSPIMYAVYSRPVGNHDVLSVQLFSRIADLSFGITY